MTTEVNGSGIRPMEFNVLVKPKAVSETTAGGLILASETVTKNEFGRMEGTLVATSPMAFKFEDWPPSRDGEKPQVGQEVMFSKYQAEKFEGRDGGEYWLMKDRSIIGVMA